jgi:Cytochrome c554 and c-prime
MQKTYVQLFLFAFFCVGVFLLSRLAGRSFQNGTVELTAETQPNLAQELVELPPEAASQGIQLVRGVEPNSMMFVHPQSRSWFDVPLAPRSSASQANLTGKETDFIGMSSCKECHPKQASGFTTTAHHGASAVPDAQNMLGRYAAGENRMKSVSPDLEFTMEKDREGKFLQQVHFRGLSKTFPIDLVTGSGFVGQTYLYWLDDALYQLHVSYYRPTDGWINSPGYHDGTAWYTRTVPTKCVECHMTYVECLPNTENRYLRDTMILGVTCERCHGPAKQHVAYHRQHPNDKKAKHIANPSQLSREQSNDICAQCHFGSGIRKPGTEPFSFRPGDRVDDHWSISAKVDGPAGGVHSSNQLVRLALSKCFQESGSLRCIDCHSTHQNERGNAKLFSQRCLKCHSVNQCGASFEIGPGIENNCIDCHMPMGEDDRTAVNRMETTEFPLLRDHFIRRPKN